MSYRHPGGDAERALKLLSRLPGQIAAVWYSDDEVFHGDDLLGLLDGFLGLINELAVPLMVQ